MPEQTNALCDEKEPKQLTYKQRKWKRIRRNCLHSPYAKIFGFTTIAIVFAAIFQLIIHIASKPVAEYVENLITNEVSQEDLINFEEGDYTYDIR